ncbi:MAG: hypothetical protein II750_03485 [Bacteroidaceae bacterium]|nr:hypothetical protein [Bacteroidaceae bacterium]
MSRPPAFFINKRRHPPSPADPSTSKTPQQTSTEGSFQLRIDYITLYVPVGSADAYKATTPWKYFKELLDE